MIQKLLDKGMIRAEIIRFLIDNRIAPDSATAEFMIAISLGEIGGDVVIVDDDGNEQPKPVSSSL
jgi:hypothetical protein